MFVTRHSEMIKDIQMSQPIIVIGAGSIGSYAVMALAKLGFDNILVIDDGIVDEENIAPQFYRLGDIGRKKVDAIKAQVKMATGTIIGTSDERLETPESFANLGKFMESMIRLEGVNESKHYHVIMACDSMSARKQIFEKLIGLGISYIDARMAIEFLTVYAFPYGMSGYADQYRTTLFNDSEAVQEACTNKAISYTSAIAGGLIAKCTLDILKGKIKGDNIRTIQFDIGSLDMMVMQ